MRWIRSEPRKYVREKEPGSFLHRRLVFQSSPPPPPASCQGSISSRHQGSWRCIQNTNQINLHKISRFCKTFFYLTIKVFKNESFTLLVNFPAGCLPRWIQAFRRPPAVESPLMLSWTWTLKIPIWTIAVFGRKKENLPDNPSLLVLPSGGRWSVVEVVLERVKDEVLVLFQHQPLPLLYREN